MKLSGKVFVYSSSLFFVFMIIWSAYMFFMLPGLYRAQMLTNQKLEMATLLRSYKENRECTLNKNVKFLYETAKIPKKGDTIQLCGMYGQQHVEFHNQNAQNMLRKIQGIEHINKESIDVLREIVESNDFETLKSNVIEMKKSDFTLDVKNTEMALKFNENSEEFDVTALESQMFVILSSIKAENGIYYTNIIGILQTDEGIYASFSPSMISDTLSILPTIVESIPMFIVVFLLLLLGFTLFFTRQITQPIELLANRARNLRRGYSATPVVYKGKDEIRELLDAVESMYQEMNQNNQQLIDKNEQLQLEKERQRAFLLATSHELKTPVATSRLLVDGMVDQIGKYKDTQRYLPQVNQELKRMQMIVAQLLDAYERATLAIEKIDMQQCIEEVCSTYKYLANERSIQIDLQIIESLSQLHTSKQLFITVIDNILSNAVRYADDKSVIQVQLTNKECRIFNQCQPIPKETLAMIGKKIIAPKNQEGSGMGLYLTFQYCGILGMQIEVKNKPNGVVQTLTFK